MHPVIFKIGSFIFYTYGFFVFLAFLVGIFFFLKQAKKKNLPEQRILKLAFWLVIFGIAGARILYVISNFSSFSNQPLNILNPRQGGLIFYGGLISSSIFGICYIHHYSLSFFKVSSAAAPSISLGLSIGRIGCFFNGCCYGKPWDKGFIFASNSPAGWAFPEQPLIPTQLISSLNLLVIFFILIILQKQQKFSDNIFFYFLVFYALHRFIIEFFRADYSKVFLHLTMPQFISIGLGIFSIIAIKNIRKVKKGEKDGKITN